MYEVALSSSARMDCIITFKILFKILQGTFSPWANTPKIGFFVPCRGTSAIIYF